MITKSVETYRGLIVYSCKEFVHCDLKVKPRQSQAFTQGSRTKWCHTAPEVLSGQHPVSPTSDPFSLRVIFKKLNAKLPFNWIRKDIIAECCNFAKWLFSSFCHSYLIIINANTGG